MTQFKYRAFVSYSHTDEAWARWLHRAIESYRMPAHLVESLQLSSNRLAPVFRDRDELASSSDLSKSIVEALSQSEHLIVICSPAAARSHWVNEEVRLFQSIRSPDHILYLLVDNPAHSFPPAALNDDQGRHHEPLAADVRPGRDGKKAAKLKLIAGLLGVGFDELRQREAQRNQRRLIGIAAASTFGMAVAIALSVIAVVQSRNAESERDRANHEARVATSTTDFMVDLFMAPTEGLGEAMTARNLLDRGLERISNETVNDAELRARLLRAMGIAYARLGSYQKGRELQLEAAALFETELGDQNSSLALAYHSLGGLNLELAEYEEAERYYQKALAIFATDPERYKGETALAVHSYGDLLIDKARFAEAEDQLRMALDVYNAFPVKTMRRLGGRKYFREWGAASVNSSLAHLRSQQRRVDEAVGYAEAAVDVVAPHASQDQLKFSTLLTNLGAAYAQVGRYAEAIASLEEALEIQEVVLAEDSPALAYTIANLGSLYGDTGDREKGQIFQKRALALRESIYGTDHPVLTSTLNNIAQNHMRLDEYDQAEAYILRSEQIRLASYGPDHPSLALTKHLKANLYRQTDRLEEAVQSFRDVIRIKETAGVADAWRVMEELSEVLLELGREEEAAELRARSAALSSGL